MHHTYTNIVDMDRDIGYGVLRMSEDQRWRPYYLGNPVYAFLLMVFFQYGVALHELETERIRSGEIKLRDKKDMLREMWRQGCEQTRQGLCGLPVVGGTVRAVCVRRQHDCQSDPQRLVVHHHLLRTLPRGRPGVLYRGDQGRDARPCGTSGRLSRVRQTCPVASWFHIFSGNLSFQIEHHLFPDIPAHRYSEISGEVKEICQRYGLPYNTARSTSSSPRWSARSCGWPSVGR